MLLASVVAVPLFQAMPGGSPVLGYLAAGAILGPSVTGIVTNVHGEILVSLPAMSNGKNAI